MRAKEARVISFPNDRFASRRPSTDDDGEPATNPREMIRVISTILLTFAAMVLVPISLAKAFQRGAMPNVTAWMHTVDAKSTIRVFQTGSDTVTSVPLNTYILEVLCAEYVPKTPMPALEAAAVATRTYAVHAMLAARKSSGGFTAPNGQTAPRGTVTATAPSIASQGASPIAPPTAPPVTSQGAAHSTSPTSVSIAQQNGADVTDNSQLDLPLMTEPEVEQQYPNRATMFLSHVQTAIEKTAGQVVTYQNKPILAFMFDVSPGWTRSSQAVFGRDIPYLQRVACPDDAVDAARISTDTFTALQVSQVFKTSSLNWKTLKLTRAKDGFVQTVTDGSHTITGSIFASQLHLPSDDFKWQVKDNKLRVTSYGRGTDLGMSLHEASILASKGQSWESVLSHFYPDTKIQLDDRYRI